MEPNDRNAENVVSEKNVAARRERGIKEREYEKDVVYLEIVGLQESVSL